MEIKIDEKNLEEKLGALERSRVWSPRTISKLEALVRGNDSYSLFRVNPVQFATEKGITEAEAIDLFLHGTRVGLFQMNWEMLCPGCGDVVQSFGTMHAMTSNYHCDLCKADFEASMDDYIEINFTIAPPVRQIPYHQPHTLSVEDYYFKYVFSSNSYAVPGLKFADAIRQNFFSMPPALPRMLGLSNSGSRSTKINRFKKSF